MNVAEKLYLFPKYFTMAKNFLLPVLFLSVIFCNCSGNDSSTERSANNSEHEADSVSTLKINSDFDLSKIKLPEGFRISIYAQVKNARSMSLAPDGTLFIGTREKIVYAIPDKNKDGKADALYEIANGLNQPNGVAFKDGSLYIGDISTIYRIDNILKNLRKPAKPVVVTNKYPTEEHHGWKFISFGPDGKLYVPVGAPCNICDKGDPYATLTRINADGSNMEIIARGIRNTVGFDWDPLTGDLWFTDNGRDMMGDNIPNDELNRITKPGMHFGYPYCHQGDIADPEYGKGKSCSNYVPPVQLLGPHVAALGMRFNKNNALPAEYKNAIFIAEHGSWNRSKRIGYKLAVVKRDADGKTLRPEVFAEGWLQGEKVIGRPVDVQFNEQGDMFVSDDYAGLIYKIAYQR